MSILKYLLLLATAGAVIWFCLGIGLGGWQMPHEISAELWSLRWTRVVVALCVGGALACSGAALQALFGNPLADPSLIGTSSGAALGVVIVLAFGFGGLSIPMAAFSFAVITCLFVLMTHSVFGGGRFGLLIIGFIISAFCGALVALILFLSNDLILRTANTWLAGSLATAGFVPIHYALIIMVFGFLILILVGRDLDCLMLGEETATSMGVNINRCKILTVIGSAMLTGAAVSLSGIIGFLGMMIPNLLATIWGGRRSIIIIRSAIVGAVFLLVVDSMARYATYPVDLPVGIVIALLGAPFFLWIFMQATRRGNL